MPGVRFPASKRGGVGCLRVKDGGEDVAAVYFFEELGDEVILLHSSALFSYS